MHTPTSLDGPNGVVERLTKASIHCPRNSTYLRHDLILSKKTQKWPALAH